MTQVFDELIRDLESRSREVRQDAAEALGKLGDPRAVEPLIAVLQEEDSDLREHVWAMRAGDAWREVSDPQTVLPLVAALQSKDESICKAAAEALGELIDASAIHAIEALFYCTFDDKASNVRALAAEALGELGDTRALELLITALQDRNSNVRKSVAEALDKLDWKPRESTAGAFYWIAQQDWNRCVALGNLAVKPLIAVLPDENPIVRRSVAEALAQIGTHALRPLAAAMQDKDSWVRKSAAEALGEWHDSRAAGPLIATLQDEDSRVRGSAAWALGELGNASAVEPLIPILRDEYGELDSAAAARALGKLSDVRAVEPLIETIENICAGGLERARVFGDAVWALRQTLRQIGDTHVIEHTLRHRNAYVRQIATQVLGDVGGEGSVELLVDRLQDPDLLVCQEATRALGKLGGLQSVRALVDALSHSNGSVRRIASQAMGKLMHEIETQTASSIRERPVVVVIEDDPEMIDLLRLILGRKGFDPVGAVGGREGLETVFRLQPDLILLDLMMPDMDGYEVYEQIRKVLDTPVIFTTARAQWIDKALGLHVAKVNDYVTKPFGPQELLDSVNRVLATSGRDDQDALSLLQEEVKQLRRQRRDLLQRIGILEQERGRVQTQTTSLRGLELLISGIVHDLRGGLGVIRNTAGFVLDDIDGDDPFATDLRKIARSADFCEVVIRNLMALGGGEVFEPTEVDVEAVVREVFFMLERKLVDVTLIVDADPNAPTIMADEGQMKQVFMNLIKNAGEAMPDGGTLTVRTRREDEMLRVEISDTGCGILLENLDRIFDLYFTTKEKGFGIGLHVVQGIVERHGGTIQVESEINQGATFILYLPIE